MPLRRRLAPLTVVAAALVAVTAGGCSSSKRTDVGAFCRHYQAAAAAGATIADVDSVSLDQFEERITTAATEASAAAEVAPKDVEDPAKRLAADVAELRDSVRDLKDRTALEAVVRTYTAAAQDQQADAQALAGWAATNCRLATVNTTVTSTTVATSAQPG